MKASQTKRIPDRNQLQKVSRALDKERDSKAPSVSKLRDEEKRFTIFVGNPGAGKSTLLNGINKGDIFKGGRAYGTGMTRKMKLHEASPGVIYGDTPGLSDANARKVAAMEIAEALKQNGMYRILFVVKLIDGRVRDDDTATISVVLDAIKVDVSFGILINQVEEEMMVDLTSDTERHHMNAVKEALLSRANRSTSHFHLILVEEHMKSKNNAMPSPALVRKLDAFLNQVPFAKLRDGQVENLQESKYDELKKQLEDLQMKRRADLQKLETDLERARKDVEARNRAIIEEQKAEHARQMQILKKQQEEREREWQAEEQRRQTAHDVQMLEIAKKQYAGCPVVSVMFIDDKEFTYREFNGDAFMKLKKANARTFVNQIDAAEMRHEKQEAQRLLKASKGFLSPRNDPLTTPLSSDVMIRATVGEWEKFIQIRHADGTFSLQSVSGGFLSPLKAQAGPLTFRAAAPQGGWERLTFHREFGDCVRISLKADNITLFLSSDGATCFVTPDRGSLWKLMPQKKV
jgi:GTP-binding protein EngB required for normal cell division